MKYKKIIVAGPILCLLVLTVLALLLKATATATSEPGKNIDYFASQLLPTFPVYREEPGFPAFLARLIPPDAPWQYVYAEDYVGADTIMTGDDLVKFFAHSMPEAYPESLVQEWLSEDQQSYQVPVPAMQAFLLQLFAYVEEQRVQTSVYYQAETDCVVIPASLVHHTEIAYADISAILEMTGTLTMELNIEKQHLDYHEGDRMEDIYVWFQREGEEETFVWNFRFLYSRDRIQLFDMTDLSDEISRRSVPTYKWQKEGRL